MLALVDASTAFCLSAFVGSAFAVPFVFAASAEPAADAFAPAELCEAAVVAASTSFCFALSAGVCSGAVPWAPTVAANVPAMSAINSLFI